MSTRGVGSGWTEHRRTAVMAIAIGALAVLTAACGTSGSQGLAGIANLNPHQAVLASVGTTESASSASIGLSLSISGTPSIGGAASGKAINIAISGHGLFSFANKLGQFTLNIPAIGKATAGTVEIRLIGDDLYLSSPSLATLDGGKPWIHVSASSFQQNQSQSGPVGVLSDGDPTQILSLLKQLGSSVTVVGPAEVGGVATTEYQGTVDLTGSGTGSGTSTNPLGHQLARSLGLQSVPFDVWIDHDGRARQVRTSFTVIGLTVTAEEQLGDFGATVSVSPPPADQTADGTNLLQNGKLSTLFG